MAEIALKIVFKLKRLSHKSARRDHVLLRARSHYLEVKARIWPRLSYMCHVRSTATGCGGGTDLGWLITCWTDLGWLVTSEDRPGAGLRWGGQQGARLKDVLLRAP